MKKEPIDLVALKSRNLPRAKAESFLAVKVDNEEARKAMAQASEYFSHFLDATPGGPCVNCGKDQGAKDIVSGFLGDAQFAWGLAHGEGFCRNCGYPARAHHEIPGLGRVTNLILQYHPDELETANTTTE